MKATQLREAILATLPKRLIGATICPSGAARSVYPDNLRNHMEATLQQALALVGEGLIDVRQGGERIDPTGGGKVPIRLRSKPEDNDAEH